MCRVCEGGITIEVDDPVVGNRGVDTTEAVSSDAAAAEGRVDMASGSVSGKTAGRGRPRRSRRVRGGPTTPQSADTQGP